VTPDDSSPCSVNARICLICQKNSFLMKGSRSAVGALTHQFDYPRRRAFRSKIGPLISTIVSTKAEQSTLLEFLDALFK